MMVTIYHSAIAVCLFVHTFRGKRYLFQALMSGLSAHPGTGEVSAIDHVYFSPIKKEKQRKKLSKIGFPSTFNDSDMSNSNTDLDPIAGTASETSSLHNHNNKSSSSFNLPKAIDSTRNKFHISNNNSSTNLGKLPYKPSRSSSTVSISTASRSNSVSNNQSPQNLLKNNSNAAAYYPSPKKASSRFLATNNDHTFLLNNDTAPSKAGIPVSMLPQFNHTHQPSANQNSSHQLSKVTSIPTVLAPPSVLEPVSKVTSNSSNMESVNSSNTDSGSSASLRKNKKHTNLLLKSVPKSSHNRHQPSSSVGSLADDFEYESTSGSLKSYKNSDSSEHKLKSIDQDWSAKTNTASSHIGSYEIENAKIHLISPSIINEFAMLHESIRYGMKKQLENLDQETQSLMLEIDKSYEHLEQLHKEALERGNDLDTFIENMSTSKTTEIESLNPNVMCENLNDLEVRIDQVKQNMTSTKDNLKAFGSKLTVLQEWKANNEVRSKFFRNMLVVSSSAVVLAVLIKKIFF